MNAKSATVGIVGRTNAGKSTLVNRLVGEKVSIVSPVEQTTRNTVRGIVADPRGQLVLIDTPGLHKAVGPLGRILNGMARRSAAGSDILCVVFDASSAPQLEDRGWMERVCRERPENPVFVLNKNDRRPFYETMFRDLWKEVVSAPPPRPRGEAADAPPPEPLWICASAASDAGAKPVLDALFSLAPEGEPLFPEDIATDYPRKLAIADAIREKFLSRLHQELPHELGIVVRDIDERDGSWDVAADILVNRASQKPIVIGPGGSLLKHVRKCAEPELSDIFGVKIRLSLWVKVEPHWMENGRLLAEMGYAGALR